MMNDEMSPKFNDPAWEKGQSWKPNLGFSGAMDELASPRFLLTIITSDQFILLSSKIYLVVMCAILLVSFTRY